LAVESADFRRAGFCRAGCRRADSGRSKKSRIAAAHPIADAATITIRRRCIRDWVRRFSAVSASFSIPSPVIGSDLPSTLIERYTHRAKGLAATAGGRT
jgi:hypothetical protein